MMKKLLCLLLCVLLLTTCAASAFAQESTVYTPGSLTKDLLVESFARGDMIILDLIYNLSLNEQAQATLGEDAALLETISKALPYTYWSVGAGKLEDGLRVMLGAEYMPDETQSAYVSAMLDLTREGVSLMSTAIEGERLTIKWETLLSLAGLEDSEIAMILSLRDTDIQALLTELTAQIGPLMETAAQLITPYAETIAAHIAALPKDVTTDVPAQDNFPAVKTEIYAQIMPKAIGDLCIALADQLEQDTTLCALLDMALSEAGMTSAELHNGLRSFGAELQTADIPLHAFIGLDETNRPLYIQLMIEYDDGESRALTLMCYDGEAEGSTTMSVDAFLLSAQNEPINGFSVGCEFVADPLDHNVLNLAGALVYYMDKVQLAYTELYIDSEAMTTEDGQSGYSAVYAMDMTVKDGDDDVNLSIAFESAHALTAEGGEQGVVSGTMDIGAQGVQIPVSIDAYTLTTPSEEGFLSSMAEVVKLPALGIDEYTEYMELYSAAYDADLTANTTEIAFETATSEELEALAMRAVSSLSETANTLIELLPSDLSAMLSEILSE